MVSTDQIHARKLLALRAQISTHRFSDPTRLTRRRKPGRATLGLRSGLPSLRPNLSTLQFSSFPIFFTKISGATISFPAAGSQAVDSRLSMTVFRRLSAILFSWIFN